MSEELPEAVLTALATAFAKGEPEVVRWVGTCQRARMSRAARISVRGATGAHWAVFAKWPSSRKDVRRIARRAGAYQREVMFYRDLAPACRIRLPYLYFGDYTVDTGDFVLVLEDLPDARAGDCRSSSAADVRQVLRTIAALHAQWMGDERLGVVPWLPTFADPRVGRYARIELDRVLRAAARGRYARHPAELVTPLLSRLRDQLDDFLRWSSAGPQTLIHGDLHTDQALFPSTGGSVLVDWQLAQHGRVGLDTARLITLSLSPDDRRRHENSLLDAYGDALEEHGVPAGTPATRLADYRHGIAWTALVNAAFYLPAGQPRAPAAETDVYEIMFRRITAAARDHGLLPAT